MCKSHKECTELGTDPTNWSTTCPLPPPTWFEDQTELFTQAVQFAAKGDIDTAITTLESIRSADLRNWFCQHGQVSGRFRNRILQNKEHKLNAEELDPVRSPDSFRQDVFARDDYTCQYCGGKVTPKETLEYFAKAIGKEYFCTSGTNDERHGIILAFRANADHVTPWNHGGKTAPSNLVTCCWSCNYGKAGYTLNELQLTDPRFNHFINAGWNGLQEFNESLKK
jgi:hypothetical protein